MNYTKGELHRHGLEIDIRKADGDHTRLANMNESSTAYLPVYEVQAANADRLVQCWNSHDALLEAVIRFMNAWIQPAPRSMDELKTHLDIAYEKAKQAIAQAEKEVGQ